MISVNTAMSIDLYGQVVADCMGGKQQSATGGQVDYVRGAQMSKGGKSFIAFDGKKIQLAIPNMEIRNIFTEQIMAMFKTEAGRDGELLNAFCQALQTGNSDEVERLFTVYLNRRISIRDSFVQKSTKENFYHGILLGILGFKDGWYVQSNKESGDGYSDIMIKIENKDIGIIIEVKYAEGAAFDSVCKGAMQQFETEGYTEELMEEGFHAIFKYGIACYKKKCRVMLEREE